MTSLLDSFEDFTTSKDTHEIPWGLDAFPDDGTPKVLRVNVGDKLHFVPIDDNRHNVAESVIVDGSWVPVVPNERKLNIDFASRKQFDELLSIEKPGTYRLCCPLEGNDNFMRLVVIANGDDDSDYDDLDTKKESHDESYDKSYDKTKSYESKEKTNDTKTKETKESKDKTKDKSKTNDSRLQSMFESLRDQVIATVNAARLHTTDASKAVAEAKKNNSEEIKKQAGKLTELAKSAQNKAQATLSRFADVCDKMNVDATKAIHEIIGKANGARLKKPEANVKPPMAPLVPSPPPVAPKPNGWDWSRFNIFDKSVVIGPLGPVVSSSTPKPKPEPSVPFAKNDAGVLIRWNYDSLLAPNGTVRMLTIPVGTPITFKSNDGRPHNLVETDSTFKPIDTPLVDNRTNLTHTIEMDTPGVFHYISTTNPKTMRVAVNVVEDSYDDDEDDSTIAEM